MGSGPWPCHIGEICKTVCVHFFFHVDKTINEVFRGIEYKIGADNQTLNFPNLETLGSWYPSDLENIHLSKCLSARECHRDSVKHRQIVPAAAASQGCYCPWARHQDMPQTLKQKQPSQSPFPLMLGCFSGWRSEDIHSSGLRWWHRSVLCQPQLHGRWDQTRLSQRGHFPSDRAGGQQSRVWQRRPVLTCNLYVITAVDLWRNLNIVSF